MSKADYVRSQRQTRDHACHWPGCDKQVPPAMWGCKAHWFSLPKRFRDQIWATYRPGQEIRLDPSTAYIAVAHEVQLWIAEQQRQHRSMGHTSPHAAALSRGEDGGAGK